MYRWIVARFVRKAFAKSNEAFRTGDFDGLVADFAEDAQVDFPGDNIFGRSYRGREEIRGWLEHVRSDFGPLQIDVKDVMVTGPPWNTRTAAVFTDPTPLYDGSRYETWGMVYDRMSWGKVKHHRIFLDTQSLADAAERSSAAARAGAATPVAVAR